MFMKNKRMLLGLGFGVAMLLALLSTVLVALPKTHAAGSWPLEKSGSRGENVASVQYMLQAKGYQVQADGQFGSLTAQAVMSFQGKNGLTADGIVGPLTWEKLIVTTRAGDSGPAVVALQRQLNAHGSQLTTDGKFGPLTTQAVQNFQSHHSLTADGIAGPRTWNSLVGGGNGGGGGSYAVVHTPTITASFINRVLAANNSPAQGTGQAMYDYGVQYGIDPVYALAFFRHESSFGKNGIATANKSLGNIRCSTSSTTYTCHNGFRRYATWAAGYEDWYKLIRHSYVDQQNLRTIEQIVPVYAPASENDVAAYISSVEQAVDAWRAGRLS